MDTAPAAAAAAATNAAPSMPLVSGLVRARGSMRKAVRCFFRKGVAVVVQEVADREDQRMSV